MDRASTSPCSSTCSRTPIAGAPAILSKVTVKLTITHTSVDNLRIVLRSPSGTEVTLSQYAGGTGDDYVATVFDDAAASSITEGTAPFTGAYRPYAPLSALAGEDPNGTWELRVVDPWVVDSGVVQAWSLQLL